MRRLVTIALLFGCVLSLARVDPCVWLWVNLSPLDAARFAQLAADSRAQYPGETPVWFRAAHEPLLIVRTGPQGNVAEIAKTLHCCGLSQAEIESELVKAADGKEVAEIPARELLRQLLASGLRKIGYGTPGQCFDCAATALTYLDPRRYADVDDGVAHFPSVFERELKELPAAEKLQWGDFVLWRQGRSPVHVGVYLGGGLVLHKKGHGGAIAIEPIAYATEYYTDFFERSYPGRKPVELTVSRWRRP